MLNTFSTFPLRKEYRNIRELTQKRSPEFPSTPNTFPNVEHYFVFNPDRVGGRTLTVPVDSGDGEMEKFDLGGQWVGSSQRHVLNMMEEFGLRTYPQSVSQYSSSLRRIVIIKQSKLMLTMTEIVVS